MRTGAQRSYTRRRGRGAASTVLGPRARHRGVLVDGGGAIACLRNVTTKLAVVISPFPFEHVFAASKTTPWRLSVAPVAEAGTLNVWPATPSAIVKKSGPSNGSNPLNATTNAPRFTSTTNPPPKFWPGTSTGVATKATGWFAASDLENGVVVPVCTETANGLSALPQSPLTRSDEHAEPTCPTTE